jgi:hypothetical protein
MTYIRGKRFKEKNFLKRKLLEEIEDGVVAGAKSVKAIDPS